MDIITRYWPNVLYTLFVAFMCGCSTPPTVTSRPESKLVPQSTITVVCRGVDYLNVAEQMEAVLLERGFNVVSEAVARNQTRLQGEATAGESAARGSVVIENVKALRSAYFLSFTYSSRADFPHGQVFESFAGSVAELESGRIVSSFRFSQGAFGSKSVQAALKEVVSKL